MAKEIRHIWLGADSIVTALGNKRDTLFSIEAYRTGLCRNDALNMVCGRIRDEENPINGYTRLETYVIRVIESVLAQSGL